MKIRANYYLIEREAKKMTRKRFIKLLMSYGYQRNEAQKIATNFNNKKIPYEKAIKSCRRCISISASVKAFAMGINAARKRILALDQAIKDATREALRTAAGLE